MQLLLRKWTHRPTIRRGGKALDSWFEQTSANHGSSCCTHRLGCRVCANNLIWNETKARHIPCHPKRPSLAKMLPPMDSHPMSGMFPFPAIPSHCTSQNPHHHTHATSPSTHTLSGLPLTPTQE